MPVSVTDSLRTRPPEASNRCQSRSHTTAAASAVAERGDRVEPVDGQLAQALKVRAFAAEALEQEGGVGDLKLVPAVDHRRVAVGCMVALRKPVGHLGW